MEANVRTGIIKQDGYYSGALENADLGGWVWSCDHAHPDDISAEFCSLDELLATRRNFEEDDYDDIWED